MSCVTNDMSTDIHTLAGAYALDAVDDLERAAFARHLDGCQSCALEVAELLNTAARLTDPTWAAPPAGLREAVLAEVGRTPQLRQRSGARQVRSTPVAWRRWTAAAVAAGLLAAGAGVVSRAVADGQVRDERARAARVNEVLGAPDAQLRTVAMAGGQVTLVVSASRNAGVAILSGLDDPGAGQGYQLWLVRGSDSYRAVGLLGTGRNGGSVTIAALDSSDAFGVSREPAGGSRTGKPSGPVVGVIPLG